MNQVALTTRQRSTILMGLRLFQAHQKGNQEITSDDVVAWLGGGKHGPLQAAAIDSLAEKLNYAEEILLVEAVDTSSRAERCCLCGRKPARPVMCRMRLPSGEHGNVCVTCYQPPKNRK